MVFTYDCHLSLLFPSVLFFIPPSTTMLLCLIFKNFFLPSSVLSRRRHIYISLRFWTKKLMMMKNKITSSRCPRQFFSLLFSFVSIFVAVARVVRSFFFLFYTLTECARAEGGQRIVCWWGVVGGLYTVPTNRRRRKKGFWTAI